MSVRTLAVAVLAASTLLVSGCAGGDEDAAATSGSATVETEPSGEPAPETEPDTEIGLVDEEVTPVGGTFSTIFYGEFDLEYRGLADLGTADGGSAGEIRCYGVLADVTLTELEESFETGGVAVSFTRVIDADGLDLGAIQVLGCPRGYLDAGWGDLASADFPRDSIGTAVEDLVVAVVGVPVGDLDKAEAVVLMSLLGSPAVSFEVTETI